MVITCTRYIDHNINLWYFILFQNLLTEYERQLSSSTAQGNSINEDKKDGDDEREENKFSKNFCANDGGATRKASHCILSPPRTQDAANLSEEPESFKKIQSMKKYSNAINCENWCSFSAKENHCEHCRYDCSSKIPELIRFKDYESKSSRFDSNNFNNETELFAQEKSTSLWKKFFRTLSSDSGGESKHHFNNRSMTEFNRSKSKNFSNAKAVTVGSKKKKKKSLTFKIPRPKVFKGRKYLQGNKYERADMSPGIKSSCDNGSEEGAMCRVKVVKRMCQDNGALETCLHKNDQEDALERCLHKNDQEDALETRLHKNDQENALETYFHKNDQEDALELGLHKNDHGSMKGEHCTISCHQPKANEKLQRCFLQQSTANKEHKIVEPSSVDNLLRPASTSSNESFQSPVACDSGFNSAEGTSINILYFVSYFVDG